MIKLEDILNRLAIEGMVELNKEGDMVAVTEKGEAWLRESGCINELVVPQADGDMGVGTDE
jgi:predicted transcriptional regulator